MIVSRDGAIVDGILSERDIVRALGTVGAGCLTQTVQDLMTSVGDRLPPRGHRQSR